MPELRRDPVIGRWVIISTERAKRPVDFMAPQEQPDGREECPFCEGREAQTPLEITAVRAPKTAPNTPGWSVRVVSSIKPLLRIEGEINRHAKGMYDVMNGIGAHEVIIEDARHIANIADLPPARVREVLQVSVARMVDLERDPRFRYVLWFKNYGDVAGAGKIQHTRSQLIATPVIPKRAKEELVVSRRYYEEKERCLLCDVLSQELQSKERVVWESSSMVAICPFASRFPFELMFLPKRHHCDFAALQPEELDDLAKALQEVTAHLKAVLNDPPYNFVLHTAPFRRHSAGSGRWKTIEDDYHWHIELMPRLTRMAGFEWGSGFYINPVPPEEAARYLREAVVGQAMEPELPGAAPHV